MKKNILFVVDEQKFGGVSKVLTNLLDEFDYTKKNIDVLILHNTGDSIAHNVPDQVNIIYGTSFFDEIDMSLKQVLKTKNLIKILKKIRIVFYMKTGFIIKKLKQERKKILNKKYDVEIAFKDGFPVIFTASGNSTKKISWLHTDYKKFDCTKKYRKLFKKIYLNDINSIVSITNDVRKDFNAIYNCFEKTIVIENFINTKKITDLSLHENPYSSSKSTNFVWVGRLSSEKGCTRLITALIKLKKEKILKNEVFNIIGDGEEYTSILNMINVNNLKDNIKLYGFRNNPYPYIKNADMLLLTSLYEGLGLVLYEALALKTPCFSTEISEIYKTLDNGKYGMIVENNQEAIYSGLKKIILEKEIIEQYKKNVQNYKYTKKIYIIEQINNLLGEI